jgi:hypothetical protein
MYNSIPLPSYIKMKIINIEKHFKKETIFNDVKELLKKCC